MTIDTNIDQFTKVYHIFDKLQYKLKKLFQSYHFSFFDILPLLFFRKKFIVKSQAGLNSYKISVKEWTEKTNAIGIISKAEFISYIKSKI